MMLRSTFSAVALAIALPQLAAHAAGAELSVTLVGTGGPEYFPDRLGIATLVEAGDTKLLFDVGRGAAQNLYLSRVNPQGITHIFLTHLHNDHYEGLPELWITPWFLLGRDHGFEMWGPEGTEAMVQGMRAMFRHDLEKRANQFNPIENLDIIVHPLEDALFSTKAASR